MKNENSPDVNWYDLLPVKLGLLAFMALVFLLPLQMIKMVILERQKNSESVKSEISDQWAMKQYVTGPVLTIPLKFIPKNKDEKEFFTAWHILPEQLIINGEIVPEVRKRSIYKQVVYKSSLKISGSFAIPYSDIPGGYEIMWGKAYYSLGLTDNRGVKGNVTMKIDSSQSEAIPGVRDTDLFKSGISFLPPTAAEIKSHSFTLNLELSGSEGLFFCPVGKTTNTTIRSSWSSPGFTGRFLPYEREITGSGFKADWLVTNLNRNFPQNWVGSSYNTGDNYYGVDLFLPVDHYQKSFRSAKYGILFIALTFMVLLFLELTTKSRIHILSYMLVSLGLALFFSLLTALSEHLGFNFAYLLASLSIIVMLSLFTKSFFSGKRTFLIVSGLLTFLYGFIYILLSLNDFAFLAGNIGLFILLGVIMRFSGKIDLFKKEETRINP